jgi:hypothetical protein
MRAPMLVNGAMKKIVQPKLENLQNQIPAY